MRLDQYLSLCGLGSRSDVKKLIKSGKVLVNGVQRPAHYHVDGEVLVDGKVVTYKQNRYYMMHKPSGYITAKKDATHKTLGSLIEDEVSFIGRLDKDTEGLILATNDGEMIHKLTHPKYRVEKTYYVEVSNVFLDEYIKVIEAGIKTKTTTFLPANVLKLTNTSLQLTLTEGKYHQVKRMMAYFGLEVIYLKRISFGSLTLDETLRPGEYRQLTTKEINILKKCVFT